MNISSVQRYILEGIRGIKQRRLMLALGLIIGLLSGTAAVLLKNLTHFVETKSKSWLLGDQGSELSYLLPLAGIMLTMLFVKYLLKQDIGHGVSKILFSISKLHVPISNIRTDIFEYNFLYILQKWGTEGMTAISYTAKIKSKSLSNFFSEEEE